MEKPKSPRRQSKRDLAEALLKKLEEWQRQGYTPEQAIERLSVRQYDFLIDYGVNLDDLMLTTEQQKAVSAMTKAGRPKGLTYNKKYPQSKKDLFSNLENFIREQGATIQPRERQNYRDLDFELNGTAYKIVLSNPRTKK